MPSGLPKTLPHWLNMVLDRKCSRHRRQPQNKARKGQGRGITKDNQENVPRSAPPTSQPDPRPPPSRGAVHAPPGHGWGSRTLPVLLERAGPRGTGGVAILGRGRRQEAGPGKAGTNQEGPEHRGVATGPAHQPHPHPKRAGHTARPWGAGDAGVHTPCGTKWTPSGVSNCTKGLLHSSHWPGQSGSWEVPFGGRGFQPARVQDELQMGPSGFMKDSDCPAYPGHIGHPHCGQCPRICVQTLEGTAPVSVPTHTSARDTHGRTQGHGRSPACTGQLPSPLDIRSLSVP